MRLWGMLAMLLLGVSPALATTVTIEAARDTTLIEDPAGSLANGSGPFLFVGRTNQTENSIRRGLLFFDVAASLPANAHIEEVALTLYQSQGNVGLNVICLVRLQDSWGEGTSASSGGLGAPTQPGDATWLHTFYPTTYWVQPGGQFIGRASACQTVDANGYYRWESTVHLLQDVRLWLHNPGQNNGWILVGDESTPQNAKRFATRENSNLRLRPQLEVTYQLPGKDSDPDEE